MKININQEIIKGLKPCASRYENFLRHYPTFSGSLEEFFLLSEISHSDKLWVSLRLLPRTLIEVFAIDCAIQAQSYAADADAAAAYTAAAAAAASEDAAAYAAAAYTAYAASEAAAAYTAYAGVERDRQLNAIIYLSRSEVI